MNPDSPQAARFVCKWRGVDFANGGPGKVQGTRRDVRKILSKPRGEEQLQYFHGAGSGGIFFLAVFVFLGRWEAGCTRQSLS